ELVEFGAKIRDVVKAEPDISQMYLVRQLGNVLLWSGLPPELQDGATRMLERYTNGAMAEPVMEQLVTSQAAKEAGITHEDADIWDDLRGIDMYVKVPVRSSSGRVVTPAFSLDIKSSRQQYLDKIPPLARNIKHYYIDRHRVLIWPGVTWEDMHDRMTLTDEDIEKRAPWAIEQLEMAARDILIDEFFIKREMATAALKQWLPEHQVEEA